MGRSYLRFCFCRNLNQRPHGVQPILLTTRLHSLVLGFILLCFYVLCFIFWIGCVEVSSICGNCRVLGKVTCFLFLFLMNYFRVLECFCGKFGMSCSLGDKEALKTLCLTLAEQNGFGIFIASDIPFCPCVGQKFI